MHCLKRESFASFSDNEPQGHVEHNVECVKGSGDLGAEDNDLQEPKCEVDQGEHEAPWQMLVEVFDSSFEEFTLYFFVLDAQGKIVE